MREKLLLFGSFVLLLVCITPVGAHTAVYDTFTVINAPFGNEYLDVLQNDFPSPDPSITHVEITSQPKHGFVWGDLSAITFEDNMDVYFGPDFFTYRTYDGHSYSNEATVRLNIIPYQQCPIRTWLYTNTDTELSVNSNDYLGACHGSFGSAPLSEPVSGTSHGTIIPKACQDSYGHYGTTNTGCFDYTPNAGFRGWDSFTFRPWWDTGGMGDVPLTEIEVRIYVGDVPPYPSPEFPSAFLPAAMIIGMLGAVLLIQRTREH